VRDHVFARRARKETAIEASPVAFVEAGATRLIIPYVPVREPVIEDARRFVEAWGNN